MDSPDGTSIVQVVMDTELQSEPELQPEDTNLLNEQQEQITHLIKISNEQKHQIEELMEFHKSQKETIDLLRTKYEELANQDKLPTIIEDPINVKKRRATVAEYLKSHWWDIFKVSVWLLTVAGFFIYLGFATEEYVHQDVATKVTINQKQRLVMPTTTM